MSPSEFSLSINPPYLNIHNRLGDRKEISIEPIKRKKGISWRLNDIKTLTYIVAGKFNDRCFIMVDKLLNGDPNGDIQDKLYNSITNPDIHISLTGDADMMRVIKEYDQGLQRNNEHLTIDKNTLDTWGNNLQELAETDHIDLSNNYVFIINGNTIDRYILRFSDHKYVTYEHCPIRNGYFYLCTYKDQDPISDKCTDVKKYSEFLLKGYYSNRQREGFEYHDIDFYFKNGFSFILKN